MQPFPLLAASLAASLAAVRFKFTTCSPSSSQSQTASYKADWDARRLERNKILCDGIWDAGEAQPGKDSFGERLGKKIIENLKGERSG
jgi:hypothetical protein